MPDAIPASQERLHPGRSALLVVDVQDRILAALPDADRIVWNARRLIDASRLFEVPTTATEQYPERLGETNPQLASRLGSRLPKRRFSCSECHAAVAAWRDALRFQIVIVGIETHVCVLQTVLDLMDEGFQVHVVADATGSRHEVDRAVALRRLEHSGAIATTTESVLFQWCDDSRDPRFKALSALVRETPPAGA